MALPRRTVTEDQTLLARWIECSNLLGNKDPKKFKSYRNLRSGRSEARKKKWAGDIVETRTWDFLACSKLSSVGVESRATEYPYLARPQRRCRK